jgi:hypothetical protein
MGVLGGNGPRPRFRRIAHLGELPELVREIGRAWSATQSVAMRCDAIMYGRL